MHPFFSLHVNVLGWVFRESFKLQYVSHMFEDKSLRNRSLGALFLALALFAMVGYFWLLFFAPEDASFLGKSATEWAIIVPVVIIVYAVLIVVAWIGWALASTAPPLPVPVEVSEE